MHDEVTVGVDGEGVAVFVTQPVVVATQQHKFRGRRSVGLVPGGFVMGLAPGGRSVAAGPGAALVTDSEVAALEALAWRAVVTSPAGRNRPPSP